MLYPLAALKGDTLTAIQTLEKEIGAPVVALTGVEAKTAKLPAAQLQKLQELEDKLGILLVAVRPS